MPVIKPLSANGQLSSPYVGRFAPSPSGPLHFGSLVCALASFLDARAQQGQWLVRIEDIDRPREQPGAREAILSCLQDHGLLWDGPVLLQSHREGVYQHVLDYLCGEQLLYRCSCTRQRLQELGGTYDGYCRRHPPPPNKPAALRLKVDQLPAAYADLKGEVAFEDAIQGCLTEDLAAGGDFVIHRKDGLFAYQLAVVVDDIAQGITHVVRGSDLLDTTAKQIYLFRVLGYQPPRFCHIPVMINQQQQKLSKQNHAPAVESELAPANLWYACRCLGLEPPGPPGDTDISTLLRWAIDHWQIRQVPRQLTQPAPVEAAGIANERGA